MRKVEKCVILCQNRQNAPDDHNLTCESETPTFFIEAPPIDIVSKSASAGINFGVDSYIDNQPRKRTTNMTPLSRQSQKLRIAHTQTYFFGMAPSPTKKNHQ